MRRSINDLHKMKRIVDTHAIKCKFREMKAEYHRKCNQARTKYDERVKENTTSIKTQHPCAAEPARPATALGN